MRLHDDIRHVGLYILIDFEYENSHVDTAGLERLCSLVQMALVEGYRWSDELDAILLL